VNTATIAARFDLRLETFVTRSQICFDRVIELVPAEMRETITTQAAARLERMTASPESLTGAERQKIEATDPALAFRQACMSMTMAAVRLSEFAQKFSTAWPPAVRYILPSNEPGGASEQTWAPVVAWIVLQSIPAPGMRIKLFKELQLRSALAEILASMGMDDEKTWRIAARIRVLLWLADSPSIAMNSAAFWADPDVRWLTGINESSGKTYFNKEQFEELLCWLQLSALIEIALTGTCEMSAIRNIENVVSKASADAIKAGFSLASYLQQSSTDPKRAPQSKAAPDPTSPAFRDGSDVGGETND
jgi:hypothetical protein